MEEWGRRYKKSTDRRIKCFLFCFRNTLSILPQMAINIPAACWQHTSWVEGSYRVHPDYRPGTRSYPGHHRAPHRSLTTRVVVRPQWGPWLVAAGMRKTRKPSFSFCCPRTSKNKKHKILQHSKKRNNGNIMYILGSLSNPEEQARMFSLC